MIPQCIGSEGLWDQYLHQNSLTPRGTNYFHLLQELRKVSNEVFWNI